MFQSQPYGQFYRLLHVQTQFASGSASNMDSTCDRKLGLERHSNFSKKYLEVEQLDKPIADLELRVRAVAEVARRNHSEREFGLLREGIQSA